MREVLIGAGLALVLATPLLAQTAGPSAVAPTDTITVTGKIPDGNKRVCHTSSQTGSLMVKRECRTKQEWEDSRVRGIAALQRFKDQNETDARTRAAMRQAQ